MGKLQLAVRNEGDRARVHPYFLRRIKGVLKNMGWLGIKSDEDIDLTTRDSAVEPARNGPVEIDIFVHEATASEIEAADVAKLGLLLAESVGGYYFENGYKQRNVKVTIRGQGFSEFSIVR